MKDLLDNRIAELEKELAGLRRQKLTELQSQVAILQASLSDAPEAPARRGRPNGPVSDAAGSSALAAPQRRKGRPSGSAHGWAAELKSNPQAFADEPAKGRGRPKGKRVTDDDAMARITKLVTAAGKDGTSARNVASASGLFYPRVIKLMAGKFKKSGLGKWTRYTLK